MTRAQTSSPRWPSQRRSHRWHRRRWWQRRERRRQTPCGGGSSQWFLSVVKPRSVRAGGHDRHTSSDAHWRSLGTSADSDLMTGSRTAHAEAPWVSRLAERHEADQRARRAGSTQLFTIVGRLKRTIASVSGRASASREPTPPTDVGCTAETPTVFRDQERPAPGILPRTSEGWPPLEAQVPLAPPVNSRLPWRRHPEPSRARTDTIHRRPLSRRHHQSVPYLLISSAEAASEPQARSPGSSRCSASRSSQCLAPGSDSQASGRHVSGPPVPRKILPRGATLVQEPE